MAMPVFSGSGAPSVWQVPVETLRVSDLGTIQNIRNARIEEAQAPAKFEMAMAESAQRLESGQISMEATRQNIRLQEMQMEREALQTQVQAIALEKAQAQARFDALHQVETEKNQLMELNQRTQELGLKSELNDVLSQGDWDKAAAIFEDPKYARILSSDEKLTEVLATGLYKNGKWDEDKYQSYLTAAKQNAWTARKQAGIKEAEGDLPKFEQAFRNNRSLYTSLARNAGIDPAEDEYKLMEGLSQPYDAGQFVVKDGRIVKASTLPPEEAKALGWEDPKDNVMGTAPKAGTYDYFYNGKKINSQPIETNESDALSGYQAALIKAGRIKLRDSMGARPDSNDVPGPPSNQGNPRTPTVNELAGAAKEQIPWTPVDGGRANQTPVAQNVNEGPQRQLAAELERKREEARLRQAAITPAPTGAVAGQGGGTRAMAEARHAQDIARAKQAGEEQTQRMNAAVAAVPGKMASNLGSVVSEKAGAVAGVAGAIGSLAERVQRALAPAGSPAAAEPAAPILEGPIKPIAMRFSTTYAKDRTARTVSSHPLLQNESPLVKAVVAVESGGIDKAKSPTGVRGLMQVTRAAALDMGVENYTTPEGSLEAGKKYLQHMFNYFEDPYLALAAYNGGPGLIRQAVKYAGSTEWGDVVDALEYFESQGRITPGKLKEIVQYPNKVLGYLYRFENDIPEAPMGKDANAPDTTAI